MPTDALPDIIDSLKRVIGSHGLESMGAAKGGVDDDDIYISAERDSEEGPFRVTVCVRDRDGAVDWMGEPLLKLEVRPSSVLPSILKRLMAETVG